MVLCYCSYCHCYRWSCWCSVVICGIERIFGMENATLQFHINSLDWMESNVSCIHAELSLLALSTGYQSAKVHINDGFFILILCCLITCSVHAYLFHVNYHILIWNARAHTLLGMIALVVNAFNDDVFTIFEKRLWHVTIQFVGCDLIAPFNHCYDRLSAWWLTAFDGFSPSYHSYVEIGPEPNNTIVFVNNGLSTNF